MAEPSGVSQEGCGGGLVCTRIVSAVLLLVSMASWLCMTLSILPTFAKVLAAHGAAFSLPVRVGIAAYQFPWCLVPGVFLLTVLGMGFCCPKGNRGAAVLLGAAVVVTLIVETLILWSIHDVLPHLSP